MWKTFVGFCDTTAKVVAGMIAMIALISLLPIVGPFVGSVVSAGTAYRFGHVGYVYYEVSSEDRSLNTAAGQLYALKATTGRYADIGMGDKLLAASRVNMRSLNSTKGAITLELQKDQCVTVLSRSPNSDVDRTGDFNGWFWVATSACGIFQ